MANYNKKDTKRLEYVATPDDLGKWMCDLAKEHFPEPVDILEPCAGSNDLVYQIKKAFPGKTIHKYDLEPQCDNITQLDFLKQKAPIDYKKGRLCIMNPPFAKGIRFIHKAMEYCDYMVSLAATNTIINIDEHLYDFLDIWVIRNQIYKDGTKVDTACFVIKRKGV